MQKYCTWYMRGSVFTTKVLLVFIITTTTCYGLRPSSGGTNIEYTNGDFAKLITDPLLEHWFLFDYSCTLFFIFFLLTLY
jgi:hypothetical protein